MTSIIKVDNLQNQCGANIINENAGTITIGASGDTITLAAGASQSGFGRSGSVNWDTTPKTTGFTAVSGNGYFCDTTSAAFTVTLPATPAAGDIVAIADYNGTAITNNITVGRNSSNINGSAADLTINANYSAVTLVYVDATSGWRSVDSSNPNDIAATPEFIVATGGTITCDGDFKIHTFTGPGTFTVTSVGNSAGSTTVDYLVVAGGAGGGWGGGNGGGGGAGGFRQSFPNPATAGLPVTAQAYPITVGAGGAGGTGPTAPGSSGANSIFSTITSAGGGGGGSDDNHPTGKLGVAGGSGGGAGGGGGTPAPQAGGAGNTPPTSPPQGSPGGTVNSPGTIGGAGGGGHAAAGASIPGGTANGGAGGAGSPLSITGSPVFYAGGGGGGADVGGTGGSGGNGGGGTGGSNNLSSGMTAGTTNTGGGGGGNGEAAAGAAGGSGIVVIRYKFQ
jgi:hypothetical protein